MTGDTGNVRQYWSSYLCKNLTSGKQLQKPKRWYLYLDSNRKIFTNFVKTQKVVHLWNNGDCRRYTLYVQIHFIILCYSYDCNINFFSSIPQVHIILVMDDSSKQLSCYMKTVCPCETDLKTDNKKIYYFSTRVYWRLFFSTPHTISTLKLLNIYTEIWY